MLQFPVDWADASKGAERIGIQNLGSIVRGELADGYFNSLSRRTADGVWMPNLRG